MKGWKTWAAAAGFCLLGVVEIADGQTEAGIGHLTMAAGLVGLGHKIEKTAA